MLTSSSTWMWQSRLHLIYLFNSQSASVLVPPPIPLPHLHFQPDECVPSAPPLRSVRALTLFWRLVNSGPDDLSNSYYGLLKASFIVLMYGNDSPVLPPALNLNQRTFVLLSCLFPSLQILRAYLSTVLSSSPLRLCFIVSVALNAPFCASVFLFFLYL